MGPTGCQQRRQGTASTLGNIPEEGRSDQTGSLHVVLFLPVSLCSFYSEEKRHVSNGAVTYSTNVHCHIHCIVRSTVV